MKQNRLSLGGRVDQISNFVLKSDFFEHQVSYEFAQAIKNFCQNFSAQSPARMGA